MEGEVCTHLLSHHISRSVLGNSCWPLTKAWLSRMLLLESPTEGNFWATVQECGWNCKPLKGVMVHIKCSLNRIHLNISPDFYRTQWITQESQWKIFYLALTKYHISFCRFFLNFFFCRINKLVTVPSTSIWMIAFFLDMGWKLITP